MLSAGHDPSGPGDVQSLFYALPEGAAFDVPRLSKPFTDGQLANLIAAVAG